MTYFRPTCREIRSAFCTCGYRPIDQGCGTVFTLTLGASGRGGIDFHGKSFDTK
jgi:hypothetical protein